MNYYKIVTDYICNIVPDHTTIRFTVDKMMIAVNMLSWIFIYLMIFGKQSWMNDFSMRHFVI